MTTHELIAFLSERLKIKVNSESGLYGGTEVTVSLVLDDEVISSDYVYLPSEDYNP